MKNDETDKYDDSEDIEVSVSGIVFDPASNSPIVILKAINSDACLPIWMGMLEASSISDALQGVAMVRPMTHDLFVGVLELSKVKIRRVTIVGLENNTFLSLIDLVVGDQLMHIDSRPSDAIALAVRLDCKVYVNKVVFAEAMIPVSQIDFRAESTRSAEGADAREKSNGVSQNPVDYTPESNYSFLELNEERITEILEDIDPADFKYKI